MYQIETYIFLVAAALGNGPLFAQQTQFATQRMPPSVTTYNGLSCFIVNGQLVNARGEICGSTYNGPTAFTDGVQPQTPSYGQQNGTQQSGIPGLDGLSGLPGLGGIPGLNDEGNSSPREAIPHKADVSAPSVSAADGDVMGNNGGYSCGTGTNGSGNSPSGHPFNASATCSGQCQSIVFNCDTNQLIINGQPKTVDGQSWLGCYGETGQGNGSWPHKILGSGCGRGQEGHLPANQPLLQSYPLPCGDCAIHRWYRGMNTAGCLGLEPKLFDWVYDNCGGCTYTIVPEANGGIGRGPKDGVSTHQQGTSQ